MTAKMNAKGNEFWLTISEEGCRCLSNSKAPREMKMAYRQSVLKRVESFLGSVKLKAGEEVPHWYTCLLTTKKACLGGIDKDLSELKRSR